MAEFDDLDGLDDLGDLEEISFDDTNPVLPMDEPEAAAPQPPMGGLGAVIYDLISKRNYQQVIQIAESQKSAIEQDPQAKALVENAKAQLQQEAQIKQYVEAAQQAIAAGQAQQAEAFLAKAREMDPSHPDLAAFAAPQPAAPAAGAFAMPAPQPAAPQPAAPMPGAPMPAAPMPGAPMPAPDAFALPDQEPDAFAFPGQPEPAADAFAMPGAPQPAAPQPAAPQPAAPQPAAPMPGAPMPADDLSGFDDPGSLSDFSFPDADLAGSPDAFPAPPPGAPMPAAPQPAAPMPAAPMPAPDAFAAPPPAADFAAPPPAADFAAPPAADFAAPPPADDFAAPPPADDFGDLSLDAGSLPEGFEPAGLEPPPPVAEPPMDGAPGGDRIPDLIEEGKAQFQQGQYQAAIDTWSRIFLIDIDHAEASQLIEQAQNKKAELERQAEEIFHGALDHIEQEQLEEAKTSLARVLELQPTHTTAKEYLDQLNAGQVPVVSRSSGTGEVDLLDDGGFGSFDGSDLAAASGIETGQSMEAAVARDRVVVVKKTDRRLIGIAALVGFLVLGGGGFLALKWNDLFPNTSKPKETTKQLDPIDRATKMFKAGKIENAVLLLEKISADEEDFEEAQALIAQWKTQIEASAQPQETGPSPEMVARRNLLLRAAREAHNYGQFIRARKYFDRANKISPLESDDLALLRDSNFKLEPIEAQITQFNDGKYKQVLPALWRLRETAPDDPNITMLIIDSYYNLALVDLQRGNPRGAAKKLSEALEVDPENEELIRMRLFADAYTKKEQDLLYRIYVKYLPSRS